MHMNVLPRWPAVPAVLLAVSAMACQTAGTGVSPRKSGPTGPVPTVSGISLQADKESVLRTFGAPVEDRPQVYDNSRYDYGDMISVSYPGIRFHLISGVNRRGSYRVLEMEIFDPIWTVTPRLYIGMPAEEAVRSVPELKNIKDARRPGQKLLVYAFPVPGTQAGGQVILRIAQDKVAQITITSDLD